VRASGSIDHGPARSTDRRTHIGDFQGATVLGFVSGRRNDLSACTPGSFKAQCTIEQDARVEFVRAARVLLAAAQRMRSIKNAERHRCSSEALRAHTQ